MTETLTARIQRHEGLRLAVYKDSRGFDTVGYGHRVLPGEDFSAGITQQQADSLLAADLMKAKNDLNGNFPWTMALDSARLGVVIEMVYQLGIHGVAGFRDMLADLQQRNYEDAAYEMLDSLWHHQEMANIIATGQPTD